MACHPLCGRNRARNRREMEKREKEDDNGDKERHGLAGEEINGHAKGTRPNHHGGRSA